MGKKLPREIKVRKNQAGYRVDLRKFGGGQPQRQNVKEAIALLEQAREQDRAGGFIAPHQSPTFSQVIGKIPKQNEAEVKGSFRAYVKYRLKQKEIGKGEYDNKNSYLEILRNLEYEDGKTLGDTKLSDLRTGMIQLGIVPSLFANRSNKYARNIFSVFQQVFKFALLKELIKVNPADDKAINLPKKDNKEDKIGPRISADIIKKIIKNAGPYALKIKFAAYTGLRWGEQVALTWDDVDLKKNIIKVRKARNEDGTIGGPKSKAGKRNVFIGKPLVADLRKWKLEQSPDLLRYNLVFPHTDGYYPPVNNWRRCGLYPAIKRAGVQHITWHHLRHFYASVLLFDTHLNMSVIANQLGHSSIRTTENNYRHWIEDEQRNEAIYDEMSRVMGGI